MTEKSFSTVSDYIYEGGKNIVEGEVLESLPSTLFKVKLDDGREILGHLSGKMRLHYIKVLPGDRVQVEMTPYDDTKGRIVRRLK